MMKKCLHKKLTTKFLRTKKYQDEVIVEYTSCIKCGEVFSGTVIFAQPLINTNNTTVINTPVVSVNVKVDPNPQTISQSKPKTEDAPIKPKLIKKSKPLPIKKERSAAEKDQRKNSRKPVAPQLPDGVSLGDILKAKYAALDNAEPTQVKSTTQKPIQEDRRLDDPYSDEFEDDNDVDIFLK
jgi:hypothetical protein